MQAPTLTGPRVTLRQIALADVTPRYMGWMRDAEVLRYTESRFGIYTLASLTTYVCCVLADPLSLMWAICDPMHVGNVKLGPINGYHRYGDIGILIGERDRWGRGYATEAIELLAGYAFG